MVIEQLGELSFSSDQLLNIVLAVLGESVYLGGKECYLEGLLVATLLMGALERLHFCLIGGVHLFYEGIQLGHFLLLDTQFLLALGQLAL